jgi:hypothetical protein
MNTTILMIGITIIIILGYIYLKNRPIKNSHKLPQRVELKEFNNPNNDPKFYGIQKGHKMYLSREKGTNGFNLFITILTNGKDLANLKKIIISWSEWSERIFSFHYDVTDNNVVCQGDQIRIDLGSFNNCNGSKSFLKRTAASNSLKVDLLDYEPERYDFEYENHVETQSVFFPYMSRRELNLFKKGLHYIDS